MSKSGQLIKKTAENKNAFGCFLYCMFIYLYYYSAYFESIPKYSSKVSPLS